MQGVVANGKDKTRMKQAMLNRKADVAAGGKIVGTFGANTNEGQSSSLRYHTLYTYNESIIYVAAIQDCLTVFVSWHNVP